MDLVSERVHLVLTYVDAANRASARLTAEALEAFASDPRPASAKVTNMMTRTVSQVIGSMFEEVEPGENVPTFLVRVGWIGDDDTDVRLTALGRAVLTHANRPPLEDPADEPLSVTIDPEDPFAYARVFHLLSDHGEGLLVDPYLKFEGLADVMSISSVNRILTTDDDAKNRLAIFSRVLGASTSPPTLRTVDRAKLHDRYFIPDAGPVYVLGSSLNSITKRPGVVTPIVDESGSMAIRKAYAKLWREASEVAAVTAEPKAAE